MGGQTDLIPSFMCYTLFCFDFCLFGSQGVKVLLLRVQYHATARCLVFSMLLKQL